MHTPRVYLVQGVSASCTHRGCNGYKVFPHRIHTEGAMGTSCSRILCTPRVHLVQGVPASCTHRGCNGCKVFPHRVHIEGVFGTRCSRIVYATRVHLIQGVPASCTHRGCNWCKVFRIQFPDREREFCYIPQRDFCWLPSNNYLGLLCLISKTAQKKYQRFYWKLGHIMSFWQVFI